MAEGRELTRLSDDRCYISNRQASNDKKLKYVTTRVDGGHFVTEGGQFFLGLPKEAAPRYSADDDATLRCASSTQCRGKHELGQLPLAMPSTFVTGPDAVHTGTNSRVRKACIPVLTDYQDRVFTPFVTVEPPNPVKSVYTAGPQSGVSTRALNRVVPSESTPKPSGDPARVRPVDCKPWRKTSELCQ